MWYTAGKDFKNSGWCGVCGSIKGGDHRKAPHSTEFPAWEEKKGVRPHLLCATQYWRRHTSWVRSLIFLLSISLRLARLIRFGWLLGRSLGRYLFGLIFWRRLLRFCCLFVFHIVQYQYCSSKNACYWEFIQKPTGKKPPIFQYPSWRFLVRIRKQGWKEKKRPLFCASKRIKNLMRDAKAQGGRSRTLMSYDGSPVCLSLWASEEKAHKGLYL